MTDAPPAPLVSPEVDLRGFAFMPLHVLRLRDSDLAVLASGEAFKAAVLLWCFSWHQIPAASVPNDDAILAVRSGAGSSWRKVKERALAGFVLCSDGRLYHPVVADAAREAWERREQFQEVQAEKTNRKQRYNERLKKVSAELRELGVVIPKNRSIEALEELLASAKARSADASADSSGDAARTAAGTPPGTPGMPMTGTGIETGTGTETRKKRADTKLSSGFDEFALKTYPACTGSRHWTVALHNAGVIVSAGKATEGELRRRLEGYRAHVDTGGVSGPDKVYTPQNWFSLKDEDPPWSREWAAKPTKAQQQVDSTISAGQEFLRAGGAA